MFRRGALRVQKLVVEESGLAERVFSGQSAHVGPQSISDVFQSFGSSAARRLHTGIKPATLGLPLRPDLLGRATKVRGTGPAQ